VLRNLVVNADDLGLTVGVNDGIFAAHDHGILTSASLFANAPATADAIHRARLHPSLGVGVHLTLVDGTPTLPPNRIPTLLQDDGRFRASWKPFIVACLRGRISMSEVERELTAQIDRVHAEGFRITHLDTHKHVHAYPPLFGIVARLAVRFHIPVVRVPYERWSAMARGQALASAALAVWARFDYRAASVNGIRVPQFVGRLHTGLLNSDVLAALLRTLRPGTTELMVHPGFVDEMLRGMPTRLLASRSEEVELLCAKTINDLLAEEDIQLVRHDLIPTAMLTTGSLRHAA